MNPRCPITGIPAFTSAATVDATTWPPSSFTAAAPVRFSTRPALRSASSVDTYGQDSAIQDDPVWGPGDAWEEARRLPPGTQRARAFAAALAEAREDPATPLDPRLQVAYEAFREDQRAYRSDAARILAEGMHAAANAPWSAVSLAGICRRLGAYERADEVLAGRYGMATDPAERLNLLQEWAIVAGAAGWLERERDLLGMALARGGEDAYQILGRQALAAGRRRQALALFRVLLEHHSGPERLTDAPAWALRGWGLALLPAAGDA